MLRRGKSYWRPLLYEKLSNFFLFSLGNFALTMDGSGSSYKPAVIESASLSTTSPSCKVEFYYYSGNTGYNYVRVSHVQDVNKKSIESIVFYKSLSKNTTWQKGVIGVGQRPKGWLTCFVCSCFCCSLVVVFWCAYRSSHQYTQDEATILIWYNFI